MCMQSSTPIPNTMLPTIAVNTLTFTSPPLINNGCHKITIATGIIVVTPILKFLKTKIKNAVKEGYQDRSNTNVDPTGRVFRDDEDDALETKRRIAIESGLRFAIREGGRTIGAGVVSKILT